MLLILAERSGFIINAGSYYNSSIICKYRDKLIAYTSVLVVVPFKWRAGNSLLNIYISFNFLLIEYSWYVIVLNILKSITTNGSLSNNLYYSKESDHF